MNKSSQMMTMYME